MDNDPRERVREQVDEIRAAYRQGRDSVRELSEAAVATSKNAVYAADQWVRDNSWKLLAIGVAAGFIAGFLLRGKISRREPERRRR